MAAGDSAQKNYEALRRGRHTRAERDGVSIAVAVLAERVARVFGRSNGEAARVRGAFGERKVGRVLDKLEGEGTAVLHDRQLPGSIGNLDHLVVNGSGVFTIATKRYAGRLEVRALGTELWIGGRNRSRVLVQVRRQADAIRAILVDGSDSVPVTPVICLVETELPPFTTLRVAGVLVGTARNVRRHLSRPGEALGPGQLTAIGGMLDTRLEPAPRD